MSQVSLTLTSSQHTKLLRHLFPDDGCEAVALILCGRCDCGPRHHRLLAQKIIPIPYDACSTRSPTRVTWSTDLLPPILEEAAQLNLALIKVHSHRNLSDFSEIDDHSDRVLFPSVITWTENSLHGSAVIFADGRMIGRTVDGCGRFTPFSSINVVGDDLQFWPVQKYRSAIPEFGYRIAQTFGVGTYKLLRQLSVAVVGCSGTGSPVVEQLARNSVGTLVLVDPDRVEAKNLNRILNTTKDDADNRRFKVDILARAVSQMGLGTVTKTYSTSLFDPIAIKAVASCDVVFGCMDSIDGRHLLNKLATFYLLPYFDLGVKIEANGLGGVDQVCGTVHYLQPGGSSLFSRNVYTMEQVRIAGLSRTDPVGYRSQLDQGYIRGVPENRPAVIQLNTLVASVAVNELLARLHPYRIDSNAQYAVHRISLSHGIYEHDGDGEPCSIFAHHVGRGDVEPLLDWAELSAGYTQA